MPITRDMPSIDKVTASMVRATAGIALGSGILFFSYSAYAGTFLGGGADQILTGVACLALILISCSVIEKIIQKQLDQPIEK